MYKKTITYEDYDGNERTEDFFFNLSQAELMEMDFSASGGLEKFIHRIIESQDSKRLIELFKEIIMKSYGEKSLDGKSFLKRRDGHALADDFAQTEAYSELFMELATDDKAATEFINGIIPRKLAEEVAKRQASEAKALQPAAVKPVE